MAEPTNEQIERAARRGCVAWSVARIKAAAETSPVETDYLLARSILAHARTIAEAEAREARLREALEAAKGWLEQCREAGAYVHPGVIADCEAALGEQP